MRAMNDAQVQSIREFYVVDVPLFYQDIVELVKFELNSRNQVKNNKIYIY
jgi:hypothetical protein